MVQRYEVYAHDDGQDLPVEAPHGPWVRHADYDKLWTLYNETVERFTGTVQKLQEENREMRRLMSEALPHLIIGSRLHGILTEALGE